MKIAFTSPQGCFVLKDDLYLDMQGKTTEDGGQVTYVLRMAEQLARMGHSIDIYARGYHRDGFKLGDVHIEEHPQHPNIRVIHVATSADDRAHKKEHFYPYYQEYLGQVLNLIDEQGLEYDNITGHYADGMAMAAYMSSYLEKVTKKPVPTVGVAHSLGAEKLFSTSRKSLDFSDGLSDTEHAGLVGNFLLQAVGGNNFLTRLGLEKAIIPKMDGMITLSALHARFLVDFYNYPARGRISRVPGGFNPDIFCPINMDTEKRRNALRDDLAQRYPSVGQKIDLKDKRIIVGFGRLLHEKGPHYAIEAMEDILKTNDNAVYVYIGGDVNSPKQSPEEAEYYNKCMKIARDGGYEDRVFFPGKQSQMDIAEWLYAADVYLHTGSPEPFGMVLVESAACGVPIIMSKEAGAKDDLNNGEHALYIDPHDPEDIADKIKWVFENPDDAALMADQAKRIVFAHATWPRRAEGIESFANEIASKFVDNREKGGATANPFARFALAELLAPPTQEIIIPKLTESRRLIAEAFKSANNIDVPPMLINMSEGYQSYRMALQL